MQIIISNSSSLALYEQIKEQIKSQILTGILSEDEQLPSLRQLAKDLKVSVLTTTRSYSELEQEGYITSRPGKGFYVMPSCSQLIKEQLIRDVEENLNAAIKSALKAQMSNNEVLNLLKLLMEVNENE